MKKSAKDKHFLHKPVYPGGPKAMRQFVGENLRYPAEALQNKLEGTVHVQYTIDHKGGVIEAKVVAGIGHGCDEEALRLVKLLQFSATKNRGLRVLFHQNIQIHFRLQSAPNAELPPVANPGIQYQIVSTLKKEAPEEKPQGGGYSYTIPFGS